MGFTDMSLYLFQLWEFSVMNLIFKGINIFEINGV